MTYVLQANRVLENFADANARAYSVQIANLFEIFVFTCHLVMILINYALIWAKVNPNMNNI